MKIIYQLLCLNFFLIASCSSFAQNQKNVVDQPIVLDSNKVKLFIKYPKYKHDVYSGGFIQWKNNYPLLYQKEMWYYTESFYIKRDYFSNGITMNEGMIDVSRFESQRKENEEVVVTFDGYKDVMVLLPGNKLIYVPK